MKTCDRCTGPRPRTRTPEGANVCRQCADEMRAVGDLPSAFTNLTAIVWNATPDNRIRPGHISASY